MKRISKRYSGFLISAIVITGITIVIACSGSFLDEDDAHYRVFSPYVIHEAIAKPFFRSFHYLYDERKENNLYDFDSINSGEWVKYFWGVVRENDLNYILYHSRTGEIDSLIYNLKDNNFVLTEELQKNSLLHYTDKNRVKEFLFYIGFAKRCEPYSTYTPEWYEENDKNDPRNNKVIMLDLIAGGLKQISNSKTEFIKERYIFQIERLYFQAGNFNDCYKYYTDNLNNIKISASIKYRTMGYAAGALYKMKRFGESNYMFSIIYDNCPEMKETAYFSFAPKEESDWKESLNLAKTGREKEVLWQLLGIYKDPLRAMRQIYFINPKSDLLDLLLVRSVSTAEESFMPLRDGDEGTTKNFGIKREGVNHDLYSFIMLCADKGNTNKPYLWDLATGYLSFAYSDFGTARRYLDKAMSGAKNDVMVKEQVRLIDIAIKIQEAGRIDAKFEVQIVKEIEWLKQKKVGMGEYWNRTDTFKYDGIFEWAIKRMSEKYESQGDKIKAHCLNPGNELPFYSDKDNTTAMLSYMDKKDKTDFDDFVLSVYQIKRNDIFEFEAVDLMLQHRIREAVDKFEQSPGSGEKELAGDPFLIHINDCHDCDHAALQKIKYTKLGFVKKMLEFEEKIKTDPVNAAVYYFELANGFYNITYFGNGRLFYQTAIKEYGNYYFAENNSYNNVDKNSHIFNNREIENYYLKTMELSKDPEFRAKCCMMLSKCEQNEFFISRPKGYAGNFKAGNYFRQLKENLAQTEYYKEIILECGYFRKFIAENK